MFGRRAIALSVLLVGVLAGCSDGPEGAVDGGGLDGARDRDAGSAVDTGADHDADVTEEDAAALDDAGPCAESAYRCNADGWLEQCESGAFVRRLDCTAMYCDATQHVCRAITCATGEQHCVDRSIIACNAHRTGFATTTDCSLDGEVDATCEEVAPACPTCPTTARCTDPIPVHDPCLAGEYTCTGDWLERCESGAFVHDTDCTGRYCNRLARRCDAITCAPGRQACSDRAILECNRHGTGYRNVTDCSDDGASTATCAEVPASCPTCEQTAHCVP